MSDIIWVVCYKPTAIWASVEKQFFETYGVINYGSGWRKDVVNQCLEFGDLLTRESNGSGIQWQMGPTARSSDIHVRFQYRRQFRPCIIMIFHIDL